MLKQLTLINWKSFRHAVLPIDPLTVLIGTNASGKSNVVEALQFISQIAQDKDFATALSGNGQPGLKPIRGGVDYVSFRPEKEFTLEVLTHEKSSVPGPEEEEIQDEADFLYSISIQTKPEISLTKEGLWSIGDRQNLIFEAWPLVPTQGFPQKIKIQIIEEESSEKEVLEELFKDVGEDPQRNITYSSNVPRAILNHAPSIDSWHHIFISSVSAGLSKIFILDPIPSQMRSYSPLSYDLQSDASNIAGVLAALPEDQKAVVESTISQYMAHLPERDICRIWAEPVGRLQSDAMLYCEESWVAGEPPVIVDARAMSDGTLRFLAILTALLTRPEGSQLVIEDVDSGLHPSRVDLLLKMLREIGEQRQIDILVTTHNPALLDALEPEMVPFVVVAHRDATTGESKLTPLDDIQNLPKLLAMGSLGHLAETGAIERNLPNAG